jgi:hypothetical protein
MNKSTAPSQLALKKGRPQPSAVLTAKDDRRELAPPEAAQSGVIAGATIRLSVISEQLRTLAESIAIIRAKAATGVTIEQLADYIGVINRASERGIPIVCPIHGLICAWMTEKAEGGFHFECDRGCSQAEIIAASPILCALSALEDIGEQSAALSEALTLTRNLLDDLRQALNP